jgi:hypothetical protein
MQAKRFAARMSASEVLHAAAEDLRFSWLKELRRCRGAGSGVCRRRRGCERGGERTRSAWPPGHEDGTPTQDVERFRLLVNALREAGWEAILNLSTGSAAARAVRDERLAPSGSAGDGQVPLRTIDFGSASSRRSAVPASDGRRVPSFSGAAELGCFDTEHAGLAVQLCQEGLPAYPLADLPSRPRRAGNDRPGPQMRRRLPRAGGRGAGCRRHGGARA